MIAFFRWQNWQIHSSQFIAHRFTLSCPTPTNYCGCRSSVVDGFYRNARNLYLRSTLYAVRLLNCIIFTRDKSKGYRRKKIFKIEIKEETLEIKVFSGSKRETEIKGRQIEWLKIRAKAISLFLYKLFTWVYMILQKYKNTIEQYTYIVLFRSHKYFL